MGQRRSAHPTGGKPCVILSGGPLSRRVYFETDAIELRRVELYCGREWHYWPTKRLVSIGSIFAYVPDDRLAAVICTVWEWKQEAWTEEAA